MLHAARGSQRQYDAKSKAGVHLIPVRELYKVLNVGSRGVFCTRPEPAHGHMMQNPKAGVQMIAVRSLEKFLVVGSILHIARAFLRPHNAKSKAGVHLIQ